MRKYFSTVLGVMIAAAGMGCVLFDSADALAKPKAAAAAKAQPTLADSLGELKWGMSVETAKDVIAKKIMGDFAKKIEGSNDGYVDKMRKTYDDRIESMRKSYMMLTSENSSTLSVSIVGEEFMPDASESLLVSREDNATKYYFFKDDKFYKLAIVYDSAYLGPIAFDSFCATTEAKYGAAKDEIWDDDGNFMESIWVDKTDVKLVVKNKYSSYNTFLMVFQDDAQEKILSAQHKAYYAEKNRGPEVSSAIDALTDDSDEGAENSVDALLGRTTKVDLLAGLSQEDIDVINGVYTAEEAEKKKKDKDKKPAKKKNNAKAQAGLEIF